MKKFFSKLRQPWVLPLVAIILFSLIVWFVGPLIAVADFIPLARSDVRAGIIFLALVFWGLNNLRVKKKQENANQALTDDLKSDAKKAPASAREPNGDEKVLTQRLQESLELLKGSAFDREGKLYKLPWYIIIGAPGSGKTTAIRQSGLQFPLKDQIGNEPVRGEGGTRYCDWWFTDDAILIDTAGRYTTQDNPQKIESSAWLGFLSRIKKARPKRPLNGVIITISIADVINKTATQKSLQITAIKQRVQELNNHLQMQLPVYVVFSKMDTIAGFSCFFEDLEKEDRKQLWGFAPAKKQLGSEEFSNWLDEQYSTLISNLYSRINHRLNREPNQRKRSLVCEFPRQMQALQESLQDFLQPIFATNQFETPLMLRGVFFMSSTQTEGASQWVTSLVAKQHCAPPVDRTLRDPKAYFIQKVFKEFIFKESDMGAINEQVKRRIRFIYATILMASLGGFAGALYAWSTSKSLNENYLEEMESQVEHYKEVTGGGLQQRHDWRSLNEGLELLRNLPTGFEIGDSNYTTRQGFGLYQGDKLGQQARTTYVRSLEYFFMEDLTHYLVSQVQGAFNDDERLYEALKFYLMLYHPAEMEPDNFKLWLGILWEREFPGNENLVLREQLAEHLTSALEEGVSPGPINQEVVSAARATLIKTPLDLRVFRRIKNDYLDAHREQFSVKNILGKKSELLFYRPSGLPLDEGIPSFFTFEGFHTGFSVENLKISQKIADEQWIYGDSLSQELTKQDVEKIRQSVQDHYFREYKIRWDHFLSDIALQPFGTINRGKTVVRLLSGADAPLVTLLDKIRKNTALAEAPGLSDGAKKSLDNLAEDVASNQKNRLERLVPKGSLDGAISLPGQEISDYYYDLNQYIDSTDGLPLANLQQAIKGLNGYLQDLSYSDDVGKAAFDSASGGGQRQALRDLQIAIDEAPLQLQPWFSSLSRNTKNVAIVATKTHLNQSWRNEVLAFYEDKIAGKYPLNKHGRNEIKLRDFTEFFAPGGVLDNYFNQYLKPFVDTSADPWRWKKPVGLSGQTLAFFQRSQRIREAYFDDSGQLSVAFSLKPHTLDKTASGILIDSDGQTLSYFHGPIRPVSFTWPADQSVASKLVFNLSSRGTPISARTEGEWSWFKLLDDYSRSQPNRKKDGLLVTFSVEGISSTQELLPATSLHPFDPQLLKNYAPPVRL